MFTLAVGPVLWTSGCGGENDTFGYDGPCGRGQRVVDASDSPFRETPERTLIPLGTLRATVHGDSPDNPAPTVYDHEALGDPVLTVFQPSDCGVPPIRMHAQGDLVAPTRPAPVSDLGQQPHDRKNESFDTLEFL